MEAMMIRLLTISCILASFVAPSAQPQMDKKPGVKPSPRALLLVANQGDQSLSIVDPDAGSEVAKVNTRGIRGHEVIASPDGQLAYVPIYGNSGVGLPGTDGQTVEIIDLAEHKVIDTIDLGRPVRPHCAKFGPDGLLYVTAELDNALDILDPRSQKRIGSIATQRPESHMVAITSDGKRAYTSNVHSGTVTVLDLVVRKPVTVIPVAETAQRISLSVDDRYVFTADQKEPRLAVIDTSTNQVTKWVPLPSIGYGTAPTLDVKWLLVTLPDANQVAVVDLDAMKVARTIPVPAHPVEILLRPDKPVAYVSCSKDGEVAAIDLVKWEVAKVIKTGPGADGLAWAVRK
jgi:DNA-binding beta-propeller fold protein YncE